MFTKWIFPNSRQIITIAICSVLHRRSAWRLSIIFAGIVLAKGRKTITSWFRAAVAGHSRKNRKIVRQFYKLMKLAA